MPSVPERPKREDDARSAFERHLRERIGTERPAADGADQPFVDAVRYLVELGKARLAAEQAAEAAPEPEADR